MILDTTAKWHLFDYARSKGFAGTSDGWAAETQRLVYATAVRDFCDTSVKVGLWGHERLQKAVSGLCFKALAEFERVHVGSAGVLHGHISFTGRVIPTTRQVRLQQLTVDINTQGNRANVCCRAYVNGKLRLERKCSVLVDWEAQS